MFNSIHKDNFQTIITRYLISAIIILFSFSNKKVMASDNFFLGHGEIIQQESDDPTLLEHYLTHRAYLSAYTGLLKSFNLDSEQFTKNYEIAWQDYLKELNIPKDKDEQKKKLQAEIAFGQKSGPDKAVTGQSPKGGKIRSPQNPKLLILELDVRFDNRKMMQVYRTFVKQSGDNLKKTLFLTTEMELKNSQWEDLNFKSGDELIKVMEQNWIPKIGENSQGTLEQTVSTTDEQYKQIESYLLETENYVPEEYKNGLWMKVSITIIKNSEDPDIGQREFSFSGKIAIYDLASKRPLSFANLGEEKHQYSYKLATEFSNQVVNNLYNFALPSISDFSKKITDFSGPFKSADIKITDFKNLDGIQNFVDLLNRRGVTLRLKAGIYRYLPEEVTLKIDYACSESDLKHFLLSFANAHLTFPENDNPYHIAYKDVGYASPISPIPAPTPATSK